MDAEHKQAIVDYIRARDPDGSVVQHIAPNANFDGGVIRYNTENLTLHRRISKLGDEEYARAHLLVHLVAELGYPARPEVLELEHKYRIGRPGKAAQSGRIDVRVRYPPDWHQTELRGRVFLFIEVKSPSSYDADLSYLETQVFNLAQLESPRPRYGVYATSRRDAGQLRDRALIVDLDRHPTWPAWNEAGRPAHDLLPTRYGVARKARFANVEAAEGSLRPLRTDVSIQEFDQLRSTLHDVVWGGGGSNNNDVFLTLVRLLMCRIYDELETADGEVYRFQRSAYEDGGLEPADAVVRRVSDLFVEAARNYLGYADAELEELVPFERKKISPAKVAWIVERLQGLSLTRNTHRDDRDLLGEFFENLVESDFTQTKGQFFTHINLVRFALLMADVAGSARRSFLTERDAQGRPRLPYLIDPSAGSGSFLVEAMRQVTAALVESRDGARLTARQREFSQIHFGNDTPTHWAREYIYGIDANPDLGLACKVSLILHGDGSTNVFVCSALQPFSSYSGRLAAGVPRDPTHPYPHPQPEQFDFVLTNPPFSVKLSEEEEEEVAGGFVLASGTASENLFVERWYQLLREGGSVAAVVPESVFDTSSNLEVRSFLYAHFWIDAVVALPYQSFKPFTATKTALLLARKKTAAEVSAWKQALGRATEALRGRPAKAVPALAFRAAVDELGIEHSIFMAEPEEVGFKRRRGLPDLPRDNDLYSDAVLEGGEDEATTVVNRYRQGAGASRDRRFGFWVPLRDLALRPSLRMDPKYLDLWSRRGGRVFGRDGDGCTVADLLVREPPGKVKKGPLDRPRLLVDLADVESRLSLLIQATEVDELGSDKIVFGEADLLISKLEPYLGKVLKNDPAQRWLGSTEWLPFRVRAEVEDVDFVRYLLLLPQMLEAYRCLQSGKRHARMVEGDFLALRVPRFTQRAQQQIGARCREELTRIGEYRRAEGAARSAMDECFDPSE